MTEMFGVTEDKILWFKIKTGDKSCFNKLFRLYYAQLYYYGIKIDHDTEFVKECIQEVFIRIWETRENLSDVQNIKSYLLVSLRRKILSEKERVRKIHIVEMGPAEKYVFLFDQNEFEKHDEVPDEIRQLLLRALNSLTHKQRELVMLYFYHELSYSEIAQIVSISVQAVRNLMYRTLIHLRESLGEKSLDSMKNMIFLVFLSFSLKKGK